MIKLKDILTEEKAAKDYDGDGTIESPEDEYMGSKDKAIKKAMKKEEHGPETELMIGDYQTKHYHMCPGAAALYKDIEDKVEDMDLAVRTAKLQDALFALEMRALEHGAVEADVDAAELIADQIMAMARMLGLEKEHNYIQGHVDKIKGAVKDLSEDTDSDQRTQIYQAPQMVTSGDDVIVRLRKLDVENFRVAVSLLTLMQKRMPNQG